MEQLERLQHPAGEPDASIMAVWTTSVAAVQIKDNAATDSLQARRTSDLEIVRCWPYPDCELETHDQRLGYREADSLASVSGLLHYISLLTDMLVLQNNREPGQKVYAGAKIVALILKLRLLHQPRQTVRYKHLLDLESPLTFIHTSHCLSIRGCSARIAGADSLSISSL
ncbi:hypothetical protein T12_6774 [Trichinella patagoniensis]|uniref:Uncharacterized protein n=1 Tax=Trichinella patagoniensis TaxID=990121 RepID=A0A0V0Z9S9_9BILA|nr:hypothetical protein T12_6774 [Trichinella patagoniensis]